MQPYSTAASLVRLFSSNSRLELGYTFGPHCFQPDGRWYLGASPSKKSVARIKQKVGDLLMPNNVEPWPEVRDRLNQILRGWCAYFRYGTTAQAYQAVDYYVYESVRHYLRRRHQVRSRGTNSCFSQKYRFQPDTNSSFSCLRAFP